MQFGKLTLDALQVAEAVNDVIASKKQAVTVFCKNADRLAEEPLDSVLVNVRCATFVLAFELAVAYSIGKEDGKLTIYAEYDTGKPPKVFKSYPSGQELLIDLCNLNLELRDKSDDKCAEILIRWSLENLHPCYYFGDDVVYAENDKKSPSDHWDFMVNVLETYYVHVKEFTEELERLYTNTMTVFAIRKLLEGELAEAQRIYDSVKTSKDNNLIRDWLYREGRYREMAIEEYLNGETHTTYVDIFLFDSLSSGAGYCSTLSEQTSMLLQETEKVLEYCPNHCDSACHECLQHFWNQRVHTQLDRYAGLELLKWSKDSTMAPSLSYKQQDALLKPLGSLSPRYTIVGDRTSHYVEHNGIKTRIYVYPAMWQEHYHTIPKDAIAVSDKQIKYALPQVD